MSELKKTESYIYAAVLKTAAWGGFGLLLILFGLYIFQILPSEVPYDQLLSMWQMPVQEANEAFNRPTGWSWITQLGRGDVVCNLAITILCLASPLAALASVPAMIKEKQYLYAGILIAIVVVLALAASGQLSAVH